MYYRVVAGRWHVFYLNYSPHSLLLRKQRVFATGPQVLVQAIPPVVVARRSWNEQRGTWTAAIADDGFGGFIQQYGPLPATLPQLCMQNPLAVERALELLEGPQAGVSDWYDLKHLSALRVAEEESIRRVTVSQESDQGRQGVVFRRARARRAQTAATVPDQAVTWPKSVNDLAAGFRYRWTESDPHSNVEPLAGGQPAAFVYLGEDPEADSVANMYARIRRARQLHAATEAVNAGIDPSEAITIAQDRLCVVYRENHALRFYRPPGYASISDPSGAQADDIAGEQ
jgi:hypothetical protein